MRDAFNRTIEYLRVSVTDRCNFRCVYCMPPQGVEPLQHSQILSYEEILRIVTVLTKHGLKRVRLTGGEPLVRRGLIEFVRNLSAIRDLQDIALTTNGSLLAPMAAELKQAGLNRVNISIDTVNAELFHQISGGGRVQDTLDGIEAALSVGLQPVKLNVVATTYLTDADLAFFLNLARNRPVAVRFIEYMPIGYNTADVSISISHLREKLTEIAGAALIPIQFPQGGGPASYFTLPGMIGRLGFIAPISEHFCSSCNRIRLTADGKIKPCLLQNMEFDIKSQLRSGINDLQLAQLLLQAVCLKPAGHELNSSGSADSAVTRQMSQIGG
ncbi:cyclic pyranopterin phosphate synthase MoaA [Anaerosporomusa subterranea]|uniref:GTP 3',8-cyclase n=1 Tax=Anaerosporomusa subterranea TaxID=1794912 RepID=A0A154BSZ7_ANASB|nr:GTP 3',8-cyclase MoaA [Anaerosporomusa subterranea]KYZ76950.1 cyclic pyranopterin phosphate synthase MoaA [Anaerosporomusa subterranea]